MTISESILSVLTDELQSAGGIQRQLPHYTYWLIKHNLILLGREGKVEVVKEWRGTRNCYLTFRKRERGSE